MKNHLVSSISLLVFISSLSAQVIRDPHTGCQAVHDNFWEADSITWSGKCKDNYTDGKGILLWYHQNKVIARYTGQMSGGYPSGKGKYEIEDYGVLQGHFKDGNLNGNGKMEFSNGGKLQGNFAMGHFLNLDKSYLKYLQKVKSSVKNTTNIYNYESTESNLFYYALVPDGEIKAVLVLFPSTSESTEYVISSNKELMQKCFDHHILTIVLSANFNKTLESDSTAMEFFNSSFEEVIAKFHAPADKFILSGLSLGGENALQYTEMSRNPKYTTSIQPVAVIGVDPPVDFSDLYYNAKKSIEKYEADTTLITESIRPALNENYFLIDYFHDLYGGSPAEVPKKYIEASPFSRKQEDGGNARFLLNVPVRLYADPDIIWNLKYKNRDYYDLNAANLSAMTRFLMMNGNQQAEFIPAIGKGYRLDGTRHPHSWSIVDPQECFEWILKIIK